MPASTNPRNLKRSLLRIMAASILGILVAAAVVAFVLRDELQAYRRQQRVAELIEVAEKSPRLGPNHPPSPNSFHPIPVLSRQPPITDFPVVSATVAKARLREDELVLGVEVGGETRAYPLNMLNGPMREILNDTLGGRAIAATW